MAVPRFAREAEGAWEGASELHLSHMPPDQQVSESASQLSVADHGAYATIDYAWAHEGEPHRGTMIVTLDPETDVVEIGWADSFHSGAAVMHLFGTESETGAVQTEGSFAAGEETWGWTIGLDLKGEELSLAMDVVPPGETGEWAVRATYRRA